MAAELVVAVVVEPLHGGVLDRAVHSLDLTIRPGMFHLGQPVLNPMFPADAAEDVLHCEDVALAVGELDAVVGEEGMEPIRSGGDQIARGDCAAAIFPAFSASPAKANLLVRSMATKT